MSVSGRIFANPAVTDDGRETAWVIESHLNSQIRYFDGRVCCTSASGPRYYDAWHTDPHRAIRFAREEDAAVILAWPLAGQGRVAQHAWVHPGLLKDKPDREPKLAKMRPLDCGEPVPAWIEVNDMFARHGLPAPPVRLRDELAMILVALREE